MHEFLGAPIFTQDRVWVVGKGPAMVVDTKGNSFRIRVGGSTRRVSYQGILSGDTFQSVFWRNPILCQPAKENVLWDAQRKLAQATCNAFVQSVAGQELIQIAPSDSRSPDEQVKQSNLQQIIAQVQQANADATDNVTPISRSDG